MATRDCSHAETFGPRRFARRELLSSVARVIVAASILPATALAETVQKQWASCGKCRTIFFDGFRNNKGRCIVGGAHIGGATRVQLPYNRPESQREQGAWRFCNKCNALFFDGFPDKGVCPAGGGHVAQGYVFVLLHGTAGLEDHFRYCAKCHAMFEQGPGHCPAGENHAAAGFKFDLYPENSQRID